MTTASVRLLKERHPEAKIVVGDGVQEVWSPIFEGNPRISRLAEVRPGDQVLWVKEYPGSRPYVDYERSTPTHRVFTNFRASPGELFFTKEERLKGVKAIGAKRPFIVIEPNIKGTWFGRNKEWGFTRYQRVVDALAGGTRIIQLGENAQTSLLGVERIITDSFREACAVLAEASLYLGPEGGLHHAAAALGKPAVVIFGGLTAPSTTGYDFHRNLYIADHPLSPCGSLYDCEHCKLCMELITEDEVIFHTKELLGI